jgi:hypothetical protein
MRHASPARAAVRPLPLPEAGGGKNYFEDRWNQRFNND